MRCTLAERFWARVNKEGPIVRPELGPCWVWDTDYNRYGSIWVDGKPQSAHRVAWFLETGKWPNPYALHKCDNTHCVRFSHLFEGTDKDNAEDRDAKGRGAMSSAKLTSAEVVAIRADLAAGLSGAHLGRLYNVDRDTISSIKLNKTWRNL